MVVDLALMVEKDRAMSSKLALGLSIPFEDYYKREKPCSSINIAQHC